MSNFTRSNRILKSSHVNYDKTKAVSLRSEAPVLKLEVTDDVDEFDFFSHPGQALERDIRDENSENEMTEAELAEKIVARAKAEADRIIEGARADAELILDRMEEDAREGLRIMEEDARNRGYNEGYAKGEAETEAFKEEARTLIATAKRERQESYDVFESEILDLVISVLDKLLTSVAKIDPQVILYLIRNGFAESKLSGDIMIRVSEEDFDTARANLDYLSSYADAGARLEIIKDHSLKQTDCVIETPFGMIDCSLEPQYESLKKSLYLILENR